MPGGRTSHSVLPPAEMGTAQQEIPVATVNTAHTLQLTNEELYILACAMVKYNERDVEEATPSAQELALQKLLAIHAFA